MSNELCGNLRDKTVPAHYSVSLMRLACLFMSLMSLRLENAAFICHASTLQSLLGGFVGRFAFRHLTDLLPTFKYIAWCLICNLFNINNSFYLQLPFADQHSTPCKKTNVLNSERAVCHLDPREAHEIHAWSQSLDRSRDKAKERNESTDVSLCSAFYAVCGETKWHAMIMTVVRWNLHVTKTKACLSKKCLLSHHLCAITVNGLAKKQKERNQSFIFHAAFEKL